MLWDGALTMHEYIAVCEPYLANMFLMPYVISDMACCVPPSTTLHVAAGKHSAHWSQPINHNMGGQMPSLYIWLRNVLVNTWLKLVMLATFDLV